VQDAAAVAQARDTLAVEEVRVDARDLRRVVGAHAHHAAGELVDELEGREVEVAPGAREERLDVFEQRGRDELVAVRLEEIQDRAAQPLHRARLGGEHVLDVLGKEPAPHGFTWR
jgi:hypothetical protein